MQKIIRTENLKKSYKKRVLFEEVNIEIEKGSTVGLVGENGCGKSVLFKLLVGLEKPDQGNVYIDGQRVGDKTDFPDNVGILINSPGYIGRYNGFENLKFLAEIKNEIGDEQIIESMRKVGLDYKDTTKVKNYSLGMKQKLGIAQAIMENQEILILDEPFNGLDFKTKSDIFKIIRSLRDENKTILLTSHEFKDIQGLCDYIYLLNDKKVEFMTDEWIKKYSEPN